MKEMVKSKVVIEMIGNVYPFYISDVNVDGSPCFTADIEKAVKYSSQARAFIDIDKVKKAGFTMKLVTKPLRINYTLGDE